MIADPYKVLGIRSDATDGELKKAYRALSKKYHPDANPDDPEAAEEKFKEIQEAYNQITDARERGTSAYGAEPGSGSSSPYGTQGAYSTYGTGRGTTYREYDNPYSAFEDFFTQWQRASRQSAQYSYNSGSSSYDNILQAAVNYINTNHYREALTALSGMPESARGSNWYYLAAVANHGMGNNITAMEYAKRAVDMEPGNITYQQLLARLSGRGTWYQTREERYTPTTGDSGWCISLCMMNLICNLCGGGGFFFC